MRTCFREVNLGAVYCADWRKELEKKEKETG